MRKALTQLTLTIALAVTCLTTTLAQETKPSIVYVATDGSGDCNTDGTDDHVEINQALLDIYKKGGGTVHLKKGTYVIDDSVVIHSNTTLEGDGWSTVITVKDDGAADWPKGRHMVTSRDATNLTIRNLKIDGKRDRFKQVKGHEGWGAGYQNTINLAKVSNATISGVWAGNNRNDAVGGGSCKNVTIQDCTFYSFGHDGFYIYKGDTAKILNNKYVIRCNAGIRLYSFNHVLIKGNLIHAQLDPVDGKGGNGIQIQWNTGEMDDIVIEDNVIFAVQGSGIRTEGFEAWNNDYSGQPGKITVRNNVIYHCVNSWSDGITVTDYDMLIENNSILNNRRGGINVATGREAGRLTAIKTIIARNNIIAGNDGPGLGTAGVSNVRILIEYNNVWNNKGGSYQGNVESKNDISVDPLFVKSDIPISSGKPEQLEIDLHLKSQYGRWDRGGKRWVSDSVTSPCIDAGDPNSAYDLEPPPNGKRINMGAYGNTREASKEVRKCPIG